MPEPALAPHLTRIATPGPVLRPSIHTLGDWPYLIARRHEPRPQPPDWPSQGAPSRKELTAARDYLSRLGPFPTPHGRRLERHLDDALRDHLQDPDTGATHYVAVVGPTQSGKTSEVTRYMLRRSDEVWAAQGPETRPGVLRMPFGYAEVSREGAVKGALERMYGFGGYPHFGRPSVAGLRQYLQAAHTLGFGLDDGQAMSTVDKESTMYANAIKDLITGGGPMLILIATHLEGTAWDQPTELPAARGKARRSTAQAIAAQQAGGSRRRPYVFTPYGPDAWRELVGPVLGMFEKVPPLAQQSLRTARTLEEMREICAGRFGICVAALRTLSGLHLAGEGRWGVPDFAVVVEGLDTAPAELN